MEPKYLERLVSTDPENTEVNDINEPFSYIEWKRRIPNIVEKQATGFYNKYLVEWFNRKKDQKVSRKFLIRQRYLYLLRELQLFFKNEEKDFWYSKISLGDENDLLLSIPYFAKKLKQISLYYLKLRQRLKNVKLKYNFVGTSIGLEQEVRNLFLETFTDLNEELSPFTAANTPPLSSICNSLVIKINETYDDFDYFDKSPYLDIDRYYDLSHEITSNYFKTKNLELSSSGWMFRSLILDPTQSYSTVVNTITGQIDEITNQETYEGFIKTYLSEDKYTETFFATNTSANVFEINIETGENNFFYPYGTIDKSSLNNNITLESVALSSLQIEGATSGNSPQDSDVITVRNGTDYQSAWCYYKQFDDRQETMSAIFPGGVGTRFRFPYPGYGLSGQTMEWTGMDISSSSEYFYFKSDIKAAVDEAYWSEPLPAASVDSLYINNSTLASNGATSNKNPYAADKIFLELNDETDLQKPTTTATASWLFRFDKAFWPIANDKPNTFLWPLHLSPTGDQYSNITVDDFCDPISIHNLNTNLSIGASSIELADKIYKVVNVNDPINAATECCWLSTDLIDFGRYRIIKQSGFSSIFWPDSITRFIWTGPTTPLSAVFQSRTHKKECRFSTNIPKLNSTTEWTQCNCKQVFHAPFGHPGETYNSYNQQADFIAVDASNSLEPFGYDTWKDSSGNSFSNSRQFAWFNTTSDVGWGDGEWTVTDKSAVLPFDLEYGKSYFYKRAGSRTSQQHPFYSVNYQFTDKPKSNWIGAVKNENGEWVSTNQRSLLDLRSGDFLKYERQNTTTNYFITSEQIEDTSSNNGSIWSTLDYIVSGTYQDTTYLMWPTQEKPMGSTDLQYPPFDFMSLSALDFWEIQSNEFPTLSTRIYSTYEMLTTNAIQDDGAGNLVAVPTVEKIYKNKNMVAFTPTVTGTYSVRVSANGQWFTDIPNLTVVPQYKEVEKLINIDVPTSGFILEQELYGWNYTRNKQQKGAKGARPYWAELYTDKQTENRYKATRFWGYPNNFIDGYLPDQSPQISLMQIEFGDVVNYQRVGYEMQWDQPLTFKEYSGVSQWCVLSSYPTTNQLNKQDIDIEAHGTYEATPIKLSNLINGLPIEITYNALSPFTWKISAFDTSTVSTNQNDLLYLKSQDRVALENRFFPTVATVPTLEKNYTEETVGGYFLPQHIGASKYVNDNFNVTLKTMLSSGSVLGTEDTGVHVGGRGRTEQDQDTLYSWTEQNEWMKAEPLSQKKAGFVKNELTKKLQTFVPYQQNNEITSLGITTSQTKIDPWGGNENSEWTDKLNEPKSFTDVPNVFAWSEDQIFKHQDLSLDQWTSDIYGNQYSLYKNLSGIRVGDYLETSGQLWTKLNDQSIAPATYSLSAAFDVIKTKTLYLELTGNKIKTIDCFLDTLFIETESAVGLIPIEFDYSTSTISVLLDNVALLENFDKRTKRFERTWFFPVEKRVVLLLTEIISNSFVPTLYLFDLTTKSFNKIFPVSSEDIQNIQLGLTGIDVFDIDRALLHYNSTYQTFLVTYKGVDNNAQMFVVDFEIEQQDKMTLQKVDRYLRSSSAATVVYPPLIANSFLLTPQSVPVGTLFSISVPALYSPTSYILTSNTPALTSLSVNSAGMFRGVAMSPGIHQINYTINNSVGSTPYTLTLIAT